MTSSDSIVSLDELRDFFFMAQRSLERHAADVKKVAETLNSLKPEDEWLEASQEACEKVSSETTYERGSTVLGCCRGSHIDALNMNWSLHMIGECAGSVVPTAAAGVLHARERTHG